MSTHAKLSPSKRLRWGLCPGSIREENKYPDERSGAAAVDGTHSHSLLAWCLEAVQTEGIRDPRAQIGQVMTDHDGDFCVDGQRAMRVQFALDYVMKRQIEMGATKIESEIHVNPMSVFGRADLAGTTDVVLYGTDVLEIIDYKDGMGSVDAERNPQMEQYVIGVLSPWIGSGSPIPYTTIRMTIIQPKLRDKGMSGIDFYEFDVNEIPNLVQRIREQAAATDAPDAPLIPGETQCKYCRAKGACTALNQQVLGTIGTAQLDVAKQAADKDPNSMTNEQIKEILEAAPLIRQMLEGVEKEAQRRLESGLVISGLKLVRGRGGREWGYPEEEMVEKLKKFGIPKDELWKTKLISPAQAEKVVWKKRDGTVKQLSERQLKTLHEEYIKKTDGKVQIALESDARPSVTLSVAGMFAPVNTSAETVAPVLPSFLQTPDFLK